jgi:hypothetical protein
MPDKKLAIECYPLTEALIDQLTIYLSRDLIGNTEQRTQWRTSRFSRGTPGQALGHGIHIFEPAIGIRTDDCFTKRSQRHLSLLFFNLQGVRKGQSLLHQFARVPDDQEH